MQHYMTFPAIDPIIVELGPISLRWYGLMYLVGFVAAWFLAKKRLSTTPWTEEQLSDLLFYGFLGVILGGRIGYVLFYQFSHFIEDPIYLFKIWTGGMSFHGGLLGVITAMALYARKIKAPFFQVADFIAPLIPIGLGAGRIGNFINAELWGRTTDVPWAIIFPNAGPLPRHPSQLYEFLLEGVVLFSLLWWFSSKPRKKGAIAGLFLLAYGCFRVVIEFFREPDVQMQGIYDNILTQGQMLSIPMILFGLFLLLRKAPVISHKEQA